MIGWHTQQVDFTLAYPQADVECPLYMEIPKGVNLVGTAEPTQADVLQLIKNLLGQLCMVPVTDGLTQDSRASSTLAYSIMRAQYY